MPINLQTLDSHRLYSAFLDALNAGFSLMKQPMLAQKPLTEQKTPTKQNKETLNREKKKLPLILSSPLSKLAGPPLASLSQPKQATPQKMSSLTLWIACATYSIYQKKRKILKKIAIISLEASYLLSTNSVHKNRSLSGFLTPIRFSIKYII